MSLLGVSFFYEGMKEWNTLSQEERIATAKAKKAEKEREAELELFKKKEDYKQDLKNDEAEDNRTRERLEKATVFGRRASQANTQRDFYKSQGYTPGVDFLIRVDQDTNEIIETWAKDRKITDDDKKTYVDTYNKAGGEGERVGQIAVMDVTGNIAYQKLEKPKTRQFKMLKNVTHGLRSLMVPRVAERRLGNSLLPSPTRRETLRTFSRSWMIKDTDSALTIRAILLV